MARIRTIKPEFFTSLTIAGLSDRAKLLFIGLWTHADDAGRCVNDERLLRAAVFPLDRKVTVRGVADLIDDLERAGLVIRYEDHHRRYLAVCGWEEHQRINRPTPSKYPPPPREGSLPTHGGLTEDSLSDHGGLTEDSPQERKGKERKGTAAASSLTGSREPHRNGSSSSSSPEDLVPITTALADWLEEA